MAGSALPQPPRAPPAPPAASTLVGLTPADLAELEGRATNLDKLDYFQLLNLPTDAAPADIKRAFYRVSRTFHPDRFFQLEDAVLKGKVHEVYKRITEAYYVLRDDRRRTRYVADIAGPEREAKLRFDEMSETESKAAVKKEQEEQVGTTVKGRQFFQTGMAEFEAGRWSGAERNFKMALTYEPQNPRYKAKFDEARGKLDDQTRRSGPDFRIK